VLLLNASHDRETGTSSEGAGGMSAREVVQAVRHLLPPGLCSIHIYNWLSTGAFVPLPGLGEQSEPHARLPDVFYFWVGT